jgi:integrase
VAEVEEISPHRAGPAAHHGGHVGADSRTPASLVFTAPEGGPVDDGNFRDRIWYPAAVAAGIRRFPPRIMRHTAASWLVIDGVPLYDVQALLGHESYRTTERYAHLAPDAHDKVVQSWARRHDASVTHERKQGRPS